MGDRGSGIRGQGRDPAVFGHAVELRRSVYRTTVRIGLGCWMALVLFVCSMVVAMEMVLPGCVLGDRRGIRAAISVPALQRNHRAALASEHRYAS